VIGDGGLNDEDDGKNEGLKWKLVESVRKKNNIITASPLTSFSKFKLHVRFFYKQFKDYVRSTPSRVNRRIRVQIREAQETGTLVS
jgi:hypothetical protein